MILTGSPGRALVWPRRWRLGAIVLLLSFIGCQTSQVPLNEPLQLDALGRPQFSRTYGLGRFTVEATSGAAIWDGAESDLLVLLAFSGGGKRSAAFAHGVLRGLRAIQVQPPGAPARTLLSDVDYISSVSGGSFPAMHYGLNRERSFETFPQEFLKVDVNAYIYGMYLMPWNWEWLIHPLYGTNDYMAAVYDRLLFHGATYNDLARRGPPLISINATDIANESTFSFLSGTFGLLCSDLGTFPVARAVAASNGFPVLFTPITLRSHAEQCRGARPPLAAPHSWAEPNSALSRRAQLARTADRYADPERTRWVHLMDGGIADNLALRGLLNIFIGLDEDTSLYRLAARRTRRILVVSVDGEAAPDPSLGRRRTVRGLGQVLSAVSGTQIDSYNFETLILADEHVRSIAGRVRLMRCAEARAIDGSPCDDVQGQLVHISLAGIDNPADRARLEAIPTGLTIPDADVDALVEYGERIARDHPVIRAVAAAAGPGRGELQGASAASRRVRAP